MNCTCTGVIHTTLTCINPITDCLPMCKESLDYLDKYNIKGDVIEFGAFNGGSARYLAEIAPTRTIWVLDTFEGMPTEEFNPEAGDHDEPGKFKPLLSPEEMFKDYNNIKWLKGRFVNTLLELPKDLKIAFAFLDCDLYLSYKQVLGWLVEHLVPRANIVIDDYRNVVGCRKAVNEFLTTNYLDIIDERLIIF